jgi:hypothetical protein
VHGKPPNIELLGKPTNTELKRIWLLGEVPTLNWNKVNFPLLPSIGLKHFELCGCQEQLIGGTNAALQGNLRGVFSEGEIHYLRRLRLDGLTESLSRS